MSKSCSESSSTCILCLCEKREPWRGHAYMQARHAEPLLHADVTRTIILCADQFIVLHVIISLQSIILFHYSVLLFE